jgi:CIC family chloride channel protein
MSHGAEPRLHSALRRVLGVVTDTPVARRAERAVRAALVRGRRQARRLSFGPRRAAAGGWDDVVDWFTTLPVSENVVLLGFAAAIGLVAALGIVGFYSLVDWADTLFIRWPGERVEQLRNPAYRPLLTALGLFAAQYVMRRHAPGEDGMNIPDVKRRVVREGGYIPMRPLAARSVASAITLGAGGSVGSEGPAAVLGGGLGSWLSRTFRFSADRTRLLVASGTAAGISAAFNAPLAGAFFALEEILGGLRVAAFPAVVVASVVASIVSQAVFGVHPAFPVPALHPSRSWFELLMLPPLLGLACGLVTVAFVRAYAGIGRWAGQWPVTPGVRALIGGAVVGALVWLSGGLLRGEGHLAIPAAVFGAAPWYLIGALGAGKVIATSLTLGAGGSGGVFAPAMYVGAATGATVAGLLAALVPGIEVSPAAWAFVAMGGVVGAATGAPVTAMLLVFELTDDYALLPPLMLVTGISLVIARRFERDTLYSGWLRRRGIVLHESTEGDMLARLRVRDAYDAAPLVLRDEEPLAEALGRVAYSAQPVFPVLDARGRLAGVLTAGAIAAAARLGEALGQRTVASFAVATPAVTRDMSLDDVLRRTATRDLEALPVVIAETGQLVGLVSRAHIMRVVERALWMEQGAGDGRSTAEMVSGSHAPS